VQKGKGKVVPPPAMQEQLYSFLNPALYGDEWSKFTAGAKVTLPVEYETG